jgi:hypothetical protein
MSLTFFYSVLLLFSFFNPSKHHLHLIRFPFLVSLFKVFFLVLHTFLKFVSQSYRILYTYKYAPYDDLIFHPTMSFFVTITQTAFNFFISKPFLYSVYSVAGYMVPAARAIVISFSFPNSTSFGLTFLFIGVGGGGGGADGCPVAWYFVRPNGRKPVRMVLAAYVPLLLR